MTEDDNVEVVEARVTKTMNSEGGELVLGENQARCLIPRRAIAEGQEIEMSLAKVWTKDYPPMEKDQLAISSMIECGPNRIVFNKPVKLTIPHSAVRPKSEDVQIWCKQEDNSGKCQL